MIGNTEMKGIQLNGRCKKISVVRATQERTGILYSEQRYLNSPRAVMKTFAPLFDRAGVEYVLAVAMTQKAEPVAVQIIGIGGLNSAVVSIPDILRFVLLANSNNLLLIHNHPSGSPTPSCEDLAITDKIEKSCELLGLSLLDHVIIGEDGMGYSCKERQTVYVEPEIKEVCA